MRIIDLLWLAARTAHCLWRRKPLSQLLVWFRSRSTTRSMSLHHTWKRNLQAYLLLAIMHSTCMHWCTGNINQAFASFVHDQDFVLRHRDPISFGICHRLTGYQNNFWCTSKRRLDTVRPFPCIYSSFKLNFNVCVHFHFNFYFYFYFPRWVFLTYCLRSGRQPKMTSNHMLKKRNLRQLKFNFGICSRVWEARWMDSDRKAVTQEKLQGQSHLYMFQSIMKLRAQQTYIHFFRMSKKIQSFESRPCLD